MRWDGPTCNCGHPADAHWATTTGCRVHSCNCLAFSQASTPSKPVSPAEKVLDAVGQGERREGERLALRPSTERGYQVAIIELAKLRGWLVYHTHDSRRSEPGFPDLVLVRGGRTLFREIKTETGRVSDAQRRWLQALNSAGQDAGLWVMPGHWDSIVETLQ